jgi:flagellin
MEVKHNMRAMMPEHKKDNSNLSKTIEKLSSGYKINSTEGNAAGLAVSEKMNKQIEGLKNALINAQDGISMFTTFEAALSEIHSILSRIKSIASAYSVNDDQLDRDANQREFEQLILEIDSIAQTDYNGIKALTGEKTDEVESENTQIDFNATALGLGLVISEVNLLTCKNAAAAVEKIDIATNRVSDIRTKIGAITNRLEHKANNLNQTIENLSDAESRLSDTVF